MQARSLAHSQHALPQVMSNHQENQFFLPNSLPIHAELDCRKFAAMIDLNSSAAPAGFVLRKRFPLHEEVASHDPERPKGFLDIITPGMSVKRPKKIFTSDFVGKHVDFALFSAAADRQASGELKMCGALVFGDCSWNGF